MSSKYSQAIPALGEEEKLIETISANLASAQQSLARLQRIVGRRQQPPVIPWEYAQQEPVILPRPTTESPEFFAGQPGEYMNPSGIGGVRINENGTQSKMRC